MVPTANFLNGMINAARTGNFHWPEHFTTDFTFYHQEEFTKRAGGSKSRNLNQIFAGRCGGLLHGADAAGSKAPYTLLDVVERAGRGQRVVGVHGNVVCTKGNNNKWMTLAVQVHPSNVALTEVHIARVDRQGQILQERVKASELHVLQISWRHTPEIASVDDKFAQLFRVAAINPSVTRQPRAQGASNVTLQRTCMLQRFLQRTCMSPDTLLRTCMTR